MVNVKVPVEITGVVGPSSPQPAVSVRAASSTSAKGQYRPSLRLEEVRPPKATPTKTNPGKPSASSPSQSAYIGAPSCSPGRGVSKADVAGVETVSVDVTALAPGVTWLGEKEQEVREARLEQVSETAWSKELPKGLRVTV